MKDVQEQRTVQKKEDVCIQSQRNESKYNQCTQQYLEKRIDERIKIVILFKSHIRLFSNSPAAVPCKVDGNEAGKKLRLFMQTLWEVWSPNG